MKKHTLKTTHAAFLKSLDTELLGMGAERYTHDPPRDFRVAPVPGYRFNTRHGILELHPDLPFDRAIKGFRKDYNLTVFGRFTDPDRAIAAGAPHWKWNHHFGYRAPDEVEDCIAHLAQRLSRMLTPSESASK